MIADSFFEQGKCHAINEDYATHGCIQYSENEYGSPYAIISDGCSNGGGASLSTDWGSRILCKAAELHLDKHQLGQWSKFLMAVGATAQTQVRVFPNLLPDCLTATLGVLQLTSKNKISCLLIGDGVICSRKRNGNWRIAHYKFNSGAPYYLHYMMENTSKKYLDKFGGIYTKTSYCGKLHDESQVLSEYVLEFDLDLSNPYFVEEFDINEYDRVFVFSDGVDSFYKQVVTDTSKHNEDVKVPDVLRVILDILGTKSNFLKSQQHWAFKQNKAGTFLSKGWHNRDDVAVGGIICD